VPEIMPSTPKEGDQRDLDSFMHSILPSARQSPCNWGKSTQTSFWITIRPFFVPKGLPSGSADSEPKAMVCSLVKISLDQYEELDRLRKEKKESLSKLIRQALSFFTKQKEHPISALPSFLPACTEDQYKTVTAYFPQDEWSLLERISKNTGKCKTELLREAMNDYLKE